MSKVFRGYDVRQPLLFATDLREWLPESHLVHFISDVVESLDLAEIYKSYAPRDTRGAPPIDPRLMLKVLIYGYSVGIRSSRKLEKATYEDVGFRILCCDQHPDHDTIASFRKRHLKALHGLFVQVLRLCQEGGLVKLGHVSLDGTKIKANAKKSKSRTYTKLKKSERELTSEIDTILAEAQAVDAEEDRRYGKRRGDELPERLQDLKNRREVIKELLGKIKKEAKSKRAEYKAEKKRKKQEDDDWFAETGERIESRPPNNPIGKPIEDVVPARRNPTDYDSRVMKDHQTGGYIQAYNCQAVVDADSQVIVAVEVTNQTNDKQLAPTMMAAVKENTGRFPETLTADAGYFSERDIISLEKSGIDPYIPPTIKSKGKRTINVGRNLRRTTVTGFMREKLSSKTGERIYRARKTIVEPVFGQLKAQRNFRQFLLRGQSQVRGEWQLAAICHNLGKLHRAHR